MLEVVCRQGRGTLTQDTEAILGTLVDELESTLLPGSTVSADRAGVPSGDGGYGVGHHASCPLSAPAVAGAAWGCPLRRLASAVHCSSCCLPPVHSAVRCGIGGVREPSHVQHLPTVRKIRVDILAFLCLGEQLLGRVHVAPQKVPSRIEPL